MNKLAALSIVVACGAVLLCSNQQQYCTDILDSLLDKAFASDELDLRNASMTSLFKKIAQNVVLKAPSGPVSRSGFKLSSSTSKVLTYYYY